MFNPARLSLARRRRGLTKKSLAEKVSVTRRMITAYESGEHEPSEGTLGSLAAQLSFPVSFFMADDPPELSAELATFRALSRMTAGQRDSAIAAGCLAIELAAWIEERFELPQPDIPDFRELDGESAAAAVRSTWGLGQKPIKNMVHLLEARGVRVFSLAEDCAEVDAFSAWSAGTPYIFLNTRKSVERSRMDAAHELGHLVLHRHANTERKESESEATEFASAFLMPHDGFVASAHRHASLRTVMAEKRRWGVSAMAYTVRLHRVRMLSDWQYRQMCMKLAQMGMRSNERHSPIESRETSQVLKKVFSQLREKGISRAEAARDLGIDREELEKLVFGLMLTGLRGGSAGSGAQGRRDHLRLVK